MDALAKHPPRPMRHVPAEDRQRRRRFSGRTKVPGAVMFHCIASMTEACKGIRFMSFLT